MLFKSKNKNLMQYICDVRFSVGGLSRIFDITDKEKQWPRRKNKYRKCITLFTLKHLVFSKNLGFADYFETDSGPADVFPGNLRTKKLKIFQNKTITQ